LTAGQLAQLLAAVGLPAKPPESKPAWMDRAAILIAVATLALTWCQARATERSVEAQVRSFELHDRPWLSVVGFAQPRSFRDRSDNSSALPRSLRSTRSPASAASAASDASAQACTPASPDRGRRRSTTVARHQSTPTFHRRGTIRADRATHRRYRHTTSGAPLCFIRRTRQPVALAGTSNGSPFMLNASSDISDPP
jgi:hypothetical protein